MHGGLSMELENIEQIHNIKRPSEVPDSGKFYFLNKRLKDIGIKMKNLY